SHDGPPLLHDVAPIDMPADTSDPDLVAYYPGETTGTTIPDASGNGHDGACTNCPGLTAGHLGQGYDFSGQRFDVPATGALLMPSAFTVALWMRLDDANGQFQCMVNKGYGSFNGDSWQICITDGQQLFFGTNNNALYATTFTIATGQFHHVAITWDGT